MHATERGERLRNLQVTLGGVVLRARVTWIGKGETLAQFERAMVRGERIAMLTQHECNGADTRKIRAEIALQFEAARLASQQLFVRRQRRAMMQASLLPIRAHRGGIAQALLDHADLARHGCRGHEFQASLFDGEQGALILLLGAGDIAELPHGIARGDLSPRQL